MTEKSKFDIFCDDCKGRVTPREVHETRIALDDPVAICCRDCALDRLVPMNKGVKHRERQYRKIVQPSLFTLMERGEKCTSKPLGTESES